MSRRSRSTPSRLLLVCVVLIVLVLASVVGIYAYRQLYPLPSCARPLGGAKVVKTQLSAPTTIGGVTEFALPSPQRQPIAPAVAPDGSVWFVELSVAGFAHLFPNNGTLIEYAWPYSYTAPPSSGGICGDKTSTWGVALWNGRVWASDAEGNQLVSFDPSTGAFSSVKLPTPSSFPYTLTDGPNDTLWFTELFSDKIGELTPGGALHEFALPHGSTAEPSQIVFANSTTGYYSAIGNASANAGGVYSFNVTDFKPVLLGGQRLTDPTSVTLEGGSLWVALHGTSRVAAYNFTTKAWSYYPTTPVSWVPTTLPYYVSGNGTSVWLNEHYGNRMARIDTANGTMTEYDESAQLTNGTTIGNAVTFALGGERAWFAELTGNAVGYASASYSPGFYTSISGNRTIDLAQGSSSTVDLVVHDMGHQGPLNLTFSDSESYTSVPSNLTFSAPATVSPPVGGDSTVDVAVSALQSLKPGTYTAILTATDGTTYESSILEIEVP